VAKKPKTVLFDSDSSESEDRNSQEEGLRQAGDEFDRYCSSTFDCDDGQMKPLHFWKTQAKRFPNLSCIYAIPALFNYVQCHRNYCDGVTLNQCLINNNNNKHRIRANMSDDTINLINC